MTNFEYERLHHNLNLLKLGTIESILDNYLEIAAKESQTAAAHTAASRRGMRGAAA